MKTYWGAAIWGMAVLVFGAAHADNKAIEEALKQALPGVKPDSITPSAMSGLYEVVVGPKLFYVSEDGRYLFQGSMIDIKEREDLTEGKLAEARVSSLKKVGFDNMIVFKPKSPKQLVHVFTDIDCGYCRKLHSEIDQYLKEGIEIRYLFFPRAGEGSDSYKKAVSVWCAEDRNEALTKAKRGDTVESRQCDNPVDQHLALGTQMGAAGTPMLVTEKGTILPGYVPASQLAKILAQESEK
ncbi:DsbC family protein [Methylocaldum sp.]|uniref:DsbC family protein n=1 Tax=Methylocaldum sp. TaxID=1969727 RepID=UPI002D680390|nr:DsbC family protein [Methylocaldum sp.]HYE36971.1 DsbC family protein [Methylocaldum sp.]